MEIRHSLPESMRLQAVELYWQAFGDKLGRVMGPKPRAYEFLHTILRNDHCICAIEGERLLGIAGYKTPQGSFSGGDPASLRQVYGHFGALWRLGLLRLLKSGVDNERFLVDGICVVADLRGHGIGTALVHGLEEEARRRGYPAIRLEVIDRNIRAQQLYQRLGFVESHRESLGLLRFAFGFSHATTMIRDLAEPTQITTAT